GRCCVSVVLSACVVFDLLSRLFGFLALLGRPDDDVTTATVRHGWCASVLLAPSLSGVQTLGPNKLKTQ
ncbi:MAG: hypothetical protein ACPIOQ_18430, partial [Promethearchaeia archaeon]